MDKQFEMWGSVGALPIVLLVLLLVLAGLIIAWRVVSKKGQKAEAKENSAQLAKSTDNTKVEAPQQTESVLGTGKLKTYALKNGELIVTTIPQPIGNVFTADTSMPESGACFFVIEKDGKVLPYDPREDAFEMDKSPQMAYFATHWEIVDQVFMFFKQWWQSVPLWLTISVLALTFIVALMTLG